jgi:CDP-paratose 2-epimerase
MSRIRSGSSRALVTGSSGLVGSGIVELLDSRGWTSFGIDNNLRRDFFGEAADTSANLQRLLSATRSFTHRALDVRDRAAIDALVAELRPSLIVHCAAQPSHDLAAQRPFDDFDVNAAGTLNLLEAARRHAPEATFAFLSTNKVYGDSPNSLPLVELPSRWDYADDRYAEGIDESMSIDRSLHSLFGASKVAADIMVQEYGRYFEMPTVCFRAGCLTGPNHAGAEQHGFLAYLARAVTHRLPYRIYGHGGKQVRDNLHADDVARAILAFHEAPTSGAVYNLGGGRANSVSVLEAIEAFERLTGERLDSVYVDEPRRGDHICYISDTQSFRTAYPDWRVEVDLVEILDSLVAANVGSHGNAAH